MESRPPSWPKTAEEKQSRITDSLVISSYLSTLTPPPLQDSDPSHRFKGKIRLRPYDDIEKSKVLVGKVKDFVHCPGHSAPLAKIKYENGENLLMFAVEGLNTKQKINSGSQSEIQIGNILPLKNIPIGTTVCNIESHTGDGGKFMRAAGA